MVDPGSQPQGRYTAGIFIQPSRVTGRLVFGAILLTLGTLWTLDNVGLMNASEVLRYWPALLVLFGLARLFGWGVPRTPLLGGILTFVGVQMLLHEFDLVQWSVLRLWPVVLIVAGTSIVWRSLRGPGQSPGDVEQAANFSVLAIMGGNTRRVTSEAFQSADVSAMMGGVELDLRQAHAASERVYIDVFAWWGGIDIVVPDNWKVESQAIPLMGAIEDNTYAPVGVPTVTLVVRGTAIMGGVEIKSASRASRKARMGDATERD
ncbi:MAG: DUF5668 domain-containing protein [Candidatus Eisenbacteria bacterium]